MLVSCFLSIIFFVFFCFSVDIFYSQFFSRPVLFDGVYTRRKFNLLSHCREKSCCWWWWCWCCCCCCRHHRCCCCCCGATFFTLFTLFVVVPRISIAFFHRSLCDKYDFFCERFFFVVVEKWLTQTKNIAHVKTFVIFLSFSCLMFSFSHFHSHFYCVVVFAVFGLSLFSTFFLFLFLKGCCYCWCCCYSSSCISFSIHSFLFITFMHLWKKFSLPSWTY